MKKINFTLAKIALLCLPSMAFASFFWETVNLPVSSGAACGDGSPYKFYVDKNPDSNNTVIMFEGGGACWTEDGCTGQLGKDLSSTNSNGIDGASKDLVVMESKYLRPGVVSPITAAWHFSEVKTQKWNKVYVPYCTGDIHTGDTVVTLGNRVQYFKGHRNAQEIAKWLKLNLPKNGQLLVTGFSAGGVGATANYVIMRDALEPTQSGLLNDSGMLYPAPNAAASYDANGNKVYPQPDAFTNDRYPSMALHNTIRGMWGFDKADGLITKLKPRLAANFDEKDLGSLTLGLAKNFPNDRFGTVVTQTDRKYSSFSYHSFNPSISPLFEQSDTKPYYAELNKLWRKDLANFKQSIDQSGLKNVGYYVPYGRPILNSHTLLPIMFGYSGIPELGKSSVSGFVNDISREDNYDTVTKPKWSWPFFYTKQVYAPVDQSWATTQRQADDGWWFSMAVNFLLNSAANLKEALESLKDFFGIN